MKCCPAMKEQKENPHSIQDTNLGIYVKLDPVLHVDTFPFLVVI